MLSSLGTSAETLIRWRFVNHKELTTEWSFLVLVKTRFAFTDPHCRPKGCPCFPESKTSAACSFEQLVYQPDPDAL